MLCYRFYPGTRVGDKYLHYRAWAALMHRAVGLDVLVGPRCGGRLRLIAPGHDPGVVRAILAHLGLAPAPDPP
ncbi:MAG: hypothetical protein AAB265_00825, partial [candidate division NC10 bacterium]